MSGSKSPRPLFERAYEYPDPVIYEASSDVDHYEELLERGRNSLRSWKDRYHNSLRKLLHYPDGEVPVAHLRRPDNSKEPRDVLRAAQVEALTDATKPGWANAFDVLVACNSWPRGAAPQQESDTGYCGSTSEASSKEAKIPACLELWLEATQVTTAEAAKKDAGRWQRRKKFTPTTPYPREFVAGLPDSTDPPKEMRNSFADAAVVGWLVDQTDDPDAIRAARWWIGESAFGVSVDLIREGYLAGCRRWINRVLGWNGSCRTKGDFHAIVQISEMVLELAPEAFNHEAPTSLWCYDDDDILRMTYPLFGSWPAETYVDKKKLRREWNAGKHADESFDDLSWWKSQEQWLDVLARLSGEKKQKDDKEAKDGERSRCRHPDAESYVNSIRRALAQIIEREAAAFNVTVAAPLNAKDSDDNTLAFLRSVEQECFASIWTGAKRLDTTPTKGKVEGSAVGEAAAVGVTVVPSKDADRSDDDTRAFIRSATQECIASILTGAKRLETTSSDRKVAGPAVSGKVGVEPGADSGENVNGPSEADDSERWMSFIEAERLTGISRGQFHRAAGDGKIPDNGKNGRARRIDRAAVTRWVEDYRKKQTG